jgi:UbiD family decarboxylase
MGVDAAIDDLAHMAHTWRALGSHLVRTWRAGADRMGMNSSVELRTGGYMHWLKWKARGEPMPCAVVLGCPPAVSYTAVQKVPEIHDELDIAGGLIGRPLNVVRCKTVDLVVPAEPRSSSRA